MLLSINSVGVVQKSPSPITTYTLTSALPAGLTYTRSDSVATCRNSAGKLAMVSSGVPRFECDISGVALGLLMEGSVQNKCTNTNCNPSATTNMTKSGDAAATLTVASDSSALATGLLDALCTSGNVFKLDNTGGSATASVDISGTTGNTNPHTISVWARSPSTGTAGALTRSGTSPGTVNISGGGYQRYVLANETPSGTTVTMRVRANPGKIIYFTLNQMEEMPFVTSEIVTSGAAATRAQDRLTLSLASHISFSEMCGFLTARYRPKGFMSATSQYLLVADNGSSTNNTIGIDILASGNSTQGYVRAGGSSQYSGNNIDTNVAGTPNAVGITWQPGAALILSGSASAGGTYASNPAGLTNLNIGSRTSGAEPFFGNISEVKVGMGYLTAAQLAALV